MLRPPMAATPLFELKPLITPAALHAHLSHPKLRIVDCSFALAKPEQGLKDYATAHLPGAVYAHLDRDLSGKVVPGVTGRHPLPDPEQLTERLGQWGIGNTDFVVAYDQQDGSMAAARLWWLLRWLGHESVAVLDGGLSAWRAAGLPLSAQVEAPAPAHFSGTPHDTLTFSRAQVVASLGSPSLALLDARAPERFRGEVEPIDKRAGHIPGARSLPLSRLVTDGRLASPGALREQFDDVLKGIHPEQSVAYCGSGVTACQLLLAASVAGIDGIRLFPGSFSEWIADEQQPVAVGDSNVMGAY
jgi:thiosulfate/3-mercaptopyruvate sulfurtransferase